MKDVTRRSAIQGALVLVAGLLIPWKPTYAYSLTKVDRILLKCVGCDVLPTGVPASSRLARIQVHPLIKSRMSLDYIGGVEVEAVDLTQHWRGRGWIVYYQANYAGATHDVLPSSWDAGHRQDIEEWINRNWYDSHGVPYDYTKRNIQGVL